MQIRPFIETYNALIEKNIGGMQSITVKNKSQGYAWRVRIGDNFAQIEEGETFILDAGAGCMYAEKTYITIEPVTPEVYVAGDFASVTVIFNKIMSLEMPKINLMSGYE